MTEVRSAWGVFKARGMRGVDDRGDFYRFWYHAWEPEPPESPLNGWWAIRYAESGLAALFPAGGNLVLTDRRLLWEPMTNGRAVYGPHGIKATANLLARAQDAVSPRTPLMWRLDRLVLQADAGRKAAVWIVADDHSPRVGFYFARGPMFSGSREERADFMARVRDTQNRSPHADTG